MYTLSGMGGVLMVDITHKARAVGLAQYSSGTGAASSDRIVVHELVRSTHIIVPLLICTLLFNLKCTYCIFNLYICFRGPMAN